MNSQQMIDHARRLAQFNKKAGDDFCRAEGPYTQACEFQEIMQEIIVHFINQPWS